MLRIKQKSLNCDVASVVKPEPEPEPELQEPFALAEPECSRTGFVPGFTSGLNIKCNAKVKKPKIRG